MWYMNEKVRAKRKMLAVLLSVSVLMTSFVPASAEENSGEKSVSESEVSSVGLADGVYTPDSFSWSGGSGRLKGISCTGITVKNGKTWATIVFASDAYTTVSAGGGQYSAISRSSGTSTFEIPVQLNANNKISGLTTKMSAGHWVDYVIYIGLEAAKTAGNTSAASDTAAGITAGVLGDTEKVTDAPEITGLTYKESLKIDYADYFKLHYYENNLVILEVNVTKDLEEAEDLPEEIADVPEEETEDEEGLFDKETIRYLLAPMDTELPAGVEKETVVIRIPAEKAYISSKEVLEIVEKLGASESIAADLSDEIGFKDLVKLNCDLEIVSSDILPHEGEEDDLTAAEQYAAMRELGEQLQVLNIPMLADRSSDETEELAKAEWYKVYGAVFGCAKEAEELYREAVEAAKE